VRPALDRTHQVVDVDADAVRHTGASAQAAVRVALREIIKRPDVRLIATLFPRRIVASPNYKLQNTHRLAYIAYLRTCATTLFYTSSLT